MIRITVATGNPGKAAEFNRILETLPGELRAQLPEGGMPHVDETADTFEGNARLKAEALSRQVSGWVVADDSGLQVDALGGEPGVRFGNDLVLLDPFRKLHVERVGQPVAAIL